MIETRDFLYTTFNNAVTHFIGNSDEIYNKTKKNDDYKKEEDNEYINVKLDNLNNDDNDEFSNSSDYSNSINTDEDTEDYLSRDLYNSKYIKKLKFSQKCFHINLIDQINDIFISHEAAIYKFYFEDKNIPNWVKNIIVYNNNNDNNDKKNEKLINNQNILDKKEDEDLFNKKVSIQNNIDNFKKDYIYVVEQHKSFMIINEIYSTIKYNFCIMVMKSLDKYLSTNERFEYIDHYNQSKIKCKCNDIDFNLSHGFILNQSIDYILIAKNDSLYFSQNSSFKHFLIPNEFVLFLLGSFLNEFNFKDEWYLFILNDKESCQYKK